MIGERGMALLSAIWVAAVLAIMAATVSQRVGSALGASTLEIQRVHAVSLHKSARRYAVAHLLQPRHFVAKAGLPYAGLRYSTPLADVKIAIRNEAGFIDVQAMSSSLAAQMSLQLRRDRDELKARISEAIDKRENIESFRVARQITDDEIGFWGTSFTFYSGLSGVNPLLASKETLGLIPGMSGAEINNRLRNREDGELLLVSTPIQNAYLHARVAAHYRLSTSFELGNDIYQEEVIVKINPQSRQAYEVVARLF